MGSLALPRAGRRAGATTAPLRAASLPAAAAAFALSAAIAHLGVALPHWREWWAHGAFFLVCGAAQVTFAGLVLWRPRPPVALLGIAGHLAILGMYVYSRTNGAPVGPHRGVPEAPGFLDLGTAAVEVALIAVLVAMLDAGPRRWAMRMVLAFGVAIWAARAAGVVA